MCLLNQNELTLNTTANQRVFYRLLFEIELLQCRVLLSHSFTAGFGVDQFLFGGVKHLLQMFQSTFNHFPQVDDGVVKFPFEQQR